MELSKPLLDSFASLYPEGVEVAEILSNAQIDNQFKHWLKKHIGFTSTEEAAYRAACGIMNSSGYWHSENVVESSAVVNSHEVVNSQSIFDSEEVLHSSDIVNGENVENGQRVFSSSMIEESSNILRGKNITQSVNVCDSQTVVNSKNIISSTNIFDSSEIIRGQNVSYSHFCQDCANIKYCLFCQNLRDAEYHIFNQPVEKNQYELFAKQYLKYLNEDLAFVEEWPGNLLAATTPSVLHFSKWFEPASKKFWKWVRTLPNFDSMLVYDITMLPEILVD